MALGYHAISGEDLLAMLRRCAAGEDPDLVYAEEYANADHEWVEGDGDDIHRQALLAIEEKMDAWDSRDRMDAANFVNNPGMALLADIDDIVRIALRP